MKKYLSLVLVLILFTGTGFAKKKERLLICGCNWNKIAQDTHFIYEKAICQTMAEKQAREIEQEKAKKAAKAKNTDSEIVNLLNFKKKHAYA